MDVIGVKNTDICRRSHQSSFIRKLFSKISNINRKTPVLESLFNKFAANLLKRDTNTGVFL